MRKLISGLLSLILLSAFPVVADTFIEAEIEFNERPVQLFEQLQKKTNFPLSFNNRQQFEQLAEELKYQPKQLQRDLATLARLYLQSTITAPNEVSHARLLTRQLESIAISPLDEAKILLLEGRIRGREDQQYQQSIILFKEALNKIASLNDSEAMTFKFVLQGYLSIMNSLLKQDTQAMYHYKQYRDLAYQMRVDYFIAQAETALGKFYVNKQQLAKALQHYNEAFRITSRLDTPVLHAHTQFQLSRLYRDLGQWDEALKNANNAAISFQQLGQQAFQSKALTVIAMVYGMQKQWNKAIDYYLNAQQIDQQNGHLIGQALNFHNIGEAYFYLDDYQSSLNYLTMANEIFKARKVLHYLVYNELLFAQVSSKQQQWQQTITHAEAALEIAESKQLIDAQKEALEYLSVAYRKVDDISSTLEVMDKMVAISQSEQESPVNDMVHSSLNEEKFKLEIRNLQQKLTHYMGDNKDQQKAIIILFAVIFIFAFLWFVSLKKLNRAKQTCQTLRQLSVQEPLTQLNGYQALINLLSSARSPKTLALVNIRALANIDINLGLSEYKAITVSLSKQLELDLHCEVFIIKPGEFGLCFSDELSAQQTLTNLQAQLAAITIANKSNIPNFSDISEQPLHAIMGHVNLPLLANPDVRLTAQLQYETVQYALAAAKSLNEDQTYVSIRSLNFAPAAIFFKPLYLNLTHALQRGIIRAETNRQAADIKWPTG
ncbi:tetratricopeptide repeat protein [Shewanella sp. 10N.286.48.A6]|uniref:tetratricopeptide repeat protein n=1 Tax=Shewanella sp. 10N.286.48.A6 TaxID=1880833 RepID=UPI000C814FD1|nr:tetratricopeptide repeat protein [Shewanella sp. 10N.286.48.A6]PMI01202.1 hypothetical protein BCU55_01390 [Shewanella sp. 10N.286.48.A6]